MKYDIIVIGGGHAGLEAAYIASQYKNLKIALITLPSVGIASAPCNPSIGGVGKGQVVREIDALGGLTGKIADLAGIQYRTLNESKGYAVQSTRIQIDKVRYSEIAESLLSPIENIEIIYEKITSLVLRNDGSYEVGSESSTWNSGKLILTVGTFLNGKLHTGSEQLTGGREGCPSTTSFTEFFRGINTVSARFKTGTPARIDKKTINYSEMEEQASCDDVPNFHCFHEPFKRHQNQVSCYLAYTNSETMKVIRDNKEKSPMFNGQINAVGARYCPSIEDKAYRYPDKDIHHVFIEPESHDLNTVYPSGISTSLPREIQKEMVRSIKGMENSEIVNYGYAVEYDVIDTTRLNYSLEHQDRKGLFFAGQVNGTSGYEEAAAQGLIAGTNAALSVLGLDNIKISRKDSYIGVMIEDLISNVRDEPYRLFTARSENRLYIREDNSVLRMRPYRENMCLANDVDSYNRSFSTQFNAYISLLENFFINPSDHFLKIVGMKLPRRMSLKEVLCQSKIDPVHILTKFFSYNSITVNPTLIRTLAISTKYSGYIAKSDSEQRKFNKIDSQTIDWSKLCDSENISFECKQRIMKIKPDSFGQLKLIEGIRPATLAVVASGNY